MTCYTNQGEIWQGGSSLSNFTLIGSGVWVLKNWNWNFTNTIAPIRGGSLAQFLQNLQGLCVSSVYTILSNLAALAR